MKLTLIGAKLVSRLETFEMFQCFVVYEWR